MNWAEIRVNKVRNIIAQTLYFMFKRVHLASTPRFVRAFLCLFVCVCVQKQVSIFDQVCTPRVYASFVRAFACLFVCVCVCAGKSRKLFSTKHTGFHDVPLGSIRFVVDIHYICTTFTLDFQ